MVKDMILNFVNFAATKITATSCDLKGGGFFGFPTWYKYLKGYTEDAANNCAPRIDGINDVWLIGLAILEILIRFAALAAIVFVVYGSFRLIYSRGNPEKINEARNTIVDALVGLIISVVAIVVIMYLGKRLGA